jgi:hypothetical protein
VIAGDLDLVLPRARAEAFVEHVRQAVVRFKVEDVHDVALLAREKQSMQGRRERA